jgi:hypothetical protein
MYNLYMVYAATTRHDEGELFIESLDTLEKVKDRFALNGWDNADCIAHDESGRATLIQSESDGVSRLIARWE